jgi:flavin reductase (DIM6/NTAB) family NADH-FMN oxidoreductase RutF
MAPYDAVSPSPTISTQAVDFKEVLAHLASGVAIVACWDGATPRGLLVSSITGLSVEPPRFLFCVRKEAACHEALLAASTLSVALLGQDDHDEAHRFAGGAKASERFDPARWSLPAAAPLYRGGLARALCRVEMVIDAGTHSIFTVSADDVVFTPGPALVAWNRALRTVG